MFMRSTTRAGLLAGAAALLLTTATAQAAGPDPSTVYVQSIRFDGTGCPAGSVGLSFANDRLTFTLIFDQFVASAGPGIDTSENRKTCDLALLLKAPVGWSWAVAGVDVRGFVSVPDPASGRISVEFQYPQTVNPAFYPALSTTFAGPIARDYLAHAETPPMQLDWSRCGGANTLRFRVTAEIVGGGAAPSQITADSIDGRIIQGSSMGGYRLVWQRCTS
jgi:Domain of unknown function (DUF4360)